MDMRNYLDSYKEHQSILAMKGMVPMFNPENFELQKTDVLKVEQCVRDTDVKKPVNIDSNLQKWLLTVSNRGLKFLPYKHITCIPR